MQWSAEAEAAIKKAPFFIRKKARQRLEMQVSSEGRDVVAAEDVHAVKKRFLNRMDEEVRGFQVDACFGPQGCPNRIVEEDNLAAAIENLLAGEDLRSFLEQSVNGPLKFHHELRVTLADCPNACSQPQIKDVGIIGAAVPEQTEVPCTACGACEEVCREGAVRVESAEAGPGFDRDRCVLCGSCIRACPTGTIGCSRKGYRLLIGGKLGRHPRLAREFPGIYDADTVLYLVKICVRYYKQHSRGGERFAALVEKAGDSFFDQLLAELQNYEERSN